MSSPLQDKNKEFQLAKDQIRIIQKHNDACAQIYMYMFDEYWLLFPIEGFDKLFGKYIH